MGAYRTPWLDVGVFRCPPGEALWHEVNDNIGPRPHVVYPAIPVGLERRAGRLVATPADVVFYRPHETYRRTLHDPRGDVSLFVAPAEVSLPAVPAAPAPAGAFLLAHRLVRRMGSMEPLVVEEAAVALVDAAVASVSAPGRARRARTRRGRSELAEAAKALLVARLARPLALAPLAAELHVSPFHLTRVFREQTGRTLSQYLHALRLREGVQRLASDSGVEITRVAHDLGYCSPSHFTDRFRGAFGFPPSQLRNRMEAQAVARS